MTGERFRCDAVGVRAEHEADGRTYLLDGEYTTAEAAQQVATEMYGGFDDVDYWAEER